MTLKFSRAEALRPMAEATVDEHFAALIASEIGPLGALHILKRMQAKTGVGPLINGDAEAVIAKASDQDQRLADIDRRRREMKSRIRAAATAAEIKELLASL